MSHFLQLDDEATYENHAGSPMSHLLGDNDVDYDVWGGVQFTPTHTSTNHETVRH